MDDVIDMLRERHDGGLVALELPDEDRLVEIEEQLLISLPGDYKDGPLYTSPSPRDRTRTRMPSSA